jgi:hypothetical protein
MSGYVRTYRKVFRNPVFKNEAEALIFIWMIAQAAWKPTRVRYKGRLIELERGQLAISIRDLASRMDRGVGTIRHLLDKLKNDEMISTVGSTASSTVGSTVGSTAVNVISICNYDIYQGTLDTDDTVDDTVGSTVDDTASSTQNKEIKNLRKESITHPTRWERPPVEVDKQVWKDFRANRKRKRMTDTATSYKQMLGDLERAAKESGKSKAWLIEYAAGKGWGSINAPNGSPSGASPRLPLPEPKPYYKVLAEQRRRREEKESAK